MNKTTRIRKISLANAIFSGVFSVVFVVFAVLFVKNLSDTVGELGGFLPALEVDKFWIAVIGCLLVCIVCAASLITLLSNVYIFVNAQEIGKQEKIKKLAQLLKVLAPFQFNANVAQYYERIAEDAERNAERIKQGCSFPDDEIGVVIKKKQRQEK